MVDTSRKPSRDGNVQMKMGSGALQPRTDGKAGAFLPGPAYAHLSLERDGAQRFPAALDAAAMGALARSLAHLPSDHPGIRLKGIDGLQPLLTLAGPIGSIAASALGPSCRAVRAILFDKTPATNWGLGWHQDRTIAVVKRVNIAGFDHWTTKAGMCHVEPPQSLLERMVTLRVHLDPVEADNAPLLVAPGSHRLGRIPESELADVVDRCGKGICLANAGDVWLYATPILHSSDRAERPHRRRVLQLDYAAGDLPGGLSWLGV